MAEILVVPEAEIKEVHGDPWQYYTDGQNFYTRKKGDEKWILAKGKAEQAIKEKIYNILVEEEKKEAEAAAAAGTEISADEPKKSETFFEMYMRTIKEATEAAKKK